MLRGILHELVGLVVDDVAFAARIVGWIGLLWLLARAFPPLSFWGAALLFAGIALLLFESTARRARAAK